MVVSANGTMRLSSAHRIILGIWEIEAHLLFDLSVMWRLHVPCPKSGAAGGHGWCDKVQAFRASAASTEGVGPSQYLRVSEAGPGRLSSVAAEEHEKLRSEIRLKNQEAEFLTVLMRVFERSPENLRMQSKR